MSDVNISLSNDVVKGIIEKKLQTTIAAALTGEVALLEAIVKTSLAVKVDSQGNIDRHGYRDSMDLIEWYCRQAITTQAKKAIEEVVATMAPKIKAEIERQMRGQIKTAAASAVASLMESTKSHWNFKAELKFEQVK